MLVSVLASVSSQCTSIRYTSHHSSNEDALLMSMLIFLNSC